MNLSPSTYPPDTRELALAYLLGIVLCSLGLSSSMFAGEPGAAACKIMLVLMLILTLYRGSGVLLLISTQLYLLFREPATLSQSYWWDAGIVSLSALGLVMFCLRFRVLLQLHDIDTLPEVRTLLRRTQVGTSIPSSGVSSGAVWRGPLIGALAGGMICVALAVLALVLVPADDRAPQLVGLLPSALRVIEVGCLLMTTVIIMIVFVHELEWRRMSAQAAVLFVKSTLTVWLFHDFRMVARRRLKLERRSSKVIDG